MSDIDLSSIPQSLTPDLSNDDTQSEEPSTPVLSKANHDALSIVSQDNLITTDTSFIKELPCRWCQRCGTLETPRWRVGPGGPTTLCNACGLKWKTLGNPSEGYTSDTYPPNPLIYPRIKRKNSAKPKTTSKKQKTASSNNNQELCDNRIPRNNNKSTKKKIKFYRCESCQTVNTPLWRKGPTGRRTLCNACGLKWAKTKTTKAPKLIPKKESAARKRFEHLLLFSRKEFITQGLYYDSSRTSTSSPFSFELPIHHGDFLMSKEKEFELPPYIHQEVDLGLVKAISATRVPFFVRIRSNIFVERKAQTNIKDPLICLCKPPPPNTAGCGDDCINRMLFYECDPKNCPCGDQCSNQRFQRKECKKGLEVYCTENRGWGLRTLKDIKKGELVIEYRGEIISQKECEERMCSLYVNDKNFYFLDYQNGEVIDATTKGTEARFINHSCDPNCHIEKWSCRGESNFGVFASENIPANSELFYDYNFSTFNGSVESHQMCHCGSKNCRGLIGSKRGAPKTKIKK